VEVRIECTVAEFERLKAVLPEISEVKIKGRLSRRSLATRSIRASSSSSGMPIRARMVSL